MATETDVKLVNARADAQGLAFRELVAIRILLLVAKMVVPEAAYRAEIDALRNRIEYGSER